jgi:DNA-binding NarL/FixJ family response regulator
MGHSASCFGTSTSAWRRLTSASGSLSLPDVQGIEAVDQVCLAAPDLLVLVLSGSTDEEVARQAVQRGAYDYFSKATAQRSSMTCWEKTG